MTTKGNRRFLAASSSDAVRSRWIESGIGTPIESAGLLKPEMRKSQMTRKGEEGAASGAPTTERHTSGKGRAGLRPAPTMETKNGAKKETARTRTRCAAEFVRQMA